TEYSRTDTPVRPGLMRTDRSVCATGRSEDQGADMSRAYKIKVKESARHVLRASDHVSTQLELLAILPPERMAELLANELKRRGFVKQGPTLVRRGQDGIVVEVDPATMAVSVKTE